MTVIEVLRQFLVSHGWEFVSNDWLFALTIIVGFTLISQLFVWLSETVIKQWTKKTKTKVDDYIIEHASGPVTILLVLIGIRLAIEVFGAYQAIASVLYHIDDTLIIILCTYIVMVVIDAIIENWAKGIVKNKKGTVADEMIDLCHKISRIFIWIAGGIIVLAAWGVNVGPFVASLGIAGIAIGFAVKDSLANIFGGISLILDKNIEVGDVIRVDDIAGTISEIGLRSTKILTFDNEVLIYPNGLLSNKAFYNWCQPDDSVRGTINFGVAYGTDIDKMRAKVTELVRGEKGVLKAPAPSVSFREFGDNALLFRLHFWVAHQADRYPTVDILMSKLYKAFEKEKIVIPFPQRDVHLTTETKK